jgi:hypothetical protein
MVFINVVITSLDQTTNLSDSVLTEEDIEHLPDPVKRYVIYAGAV